MPSLEALSGAGVFYGAAVTEARAVEGEEIHVAGGGNSAGQAAMHLSKYASKVTLLVRGGTLAASMSEYLIRELEAAGNVEIRLNIVIEEAGSRETVPSSALFVLIGATPHTGWLPEEVRRDEDGYVVTGPDLLRDGQSPEGWTPARAPLMFETSMPGVFAAGDVRYGSVKRVASAVGAGAIAIQSVHEYLSRDPALEPVR